jgi:hypothetical protein
VNNLNHLLSAAAPLFDPEALTREVLIERLNRWLSQGAFYTTDLAGIRALARDLSGLPKEVDRDAHAQLPLELRRLHCIRFSVLSPVNRKECVLQALAYCGLDERYGAELLGSAGWAVITQAVEDACACPAEPQVSPAVVVDAWTRTVFTTQVLSLLDGNWFSICDFDRVRRSLHDLDPMLGLAKPADRRLAEQAALRALHCVNFDAMHAEVRLGLPAAVLRGLGLDADNGPVLLGQDGWAQVQARYETGWPALDHPSGASEPPHEGAEGPQCPGPRRKPFWRRLFGLGQANDQAKEA